MFFDPREDLRPSPLTHNPFNALVAPRPIGWITTVNVQGQVNLAPFSYFNAISADPPMVMFAPNAKNSDNLFKDTLRNVIQVPEFVVNIATADMKEAVNQSSKAYAFGTNEMHEVGLSAKSSTNVRPPRVGDVPAALECEMFQNISLPVGRSKRQSHVIFGRVVGIYIDDAYIREGRVDQAALRLLSRLGYFYYSCTNEVFEMYRPE